jgi:hypothetical protein
MSTWVTQRRAASLPEWHLEADRPGDKPTDVWTACGQAWVPTRDVPIERRADDDSI